MFAATLVEMKPLDFLPQPMELTLSEVLLEAALLEASLDALSAPEREEPTGYTSRGTQVAERSESSLKILR
ncbi:MAG: hypothetical protein WBG38_15270 [Nodosilinea sp.]